MLSIILLLLFLSTRCKAFGNETSEMPLFQLSTRRKDFGNETSEMPLFQLSTRCKAFGNETSEMPLFQLSTRCKAFGNETSEMPLFQLSTNRVAPESIFGVNSVHHSLSQYYFLFIGRFSLTPRGERFLEKTGIFQKYEFTT